MKSAAAAILLWSLLGAAPAAAQQAGWEVRIPDKVEIVGDGATLPITIAVDRGLSISKDGDLYVDLAPPVGVNTKHRRLQRHDAVDPEADEPRFAVPLLRSEFGAIDDTMTVRIRFWVCGAKVCRPVDVRRTVQVTGTPLQER